ncbi:hypothetical protein ONZ43_g7519 [Nemania bipapillata]|uniref:Uncharacterized protein n=1 Tax=Nemania bipapillata TaxID=110536 RepID=A0ACC2HQT6_9PEZI|nr:hypothetical protein ONZ43_g7519 [Nemania bipapillata]
MAKLKRKPDSDPGSDPEQELDPESPDCRAFKRHRASGSTPCPYLADPTSVLPYKCDPSFVEELMRPGDMILHLGCRDGELSYTLARGAQPLGSVTGVNFPGEGIESAQENKSRMSTGQDSVRFIHVSDLTELPFVRGTFDVVYACDIMARLPASRNKFVFFFKTLYYFTHPHALLKSPCYEIRNNTNLVKLLKEIRRVLRPKGYLISRDIAALHFFPDGDIGGIITRALFRSTGLEGCVTVPRLLREAGFDLQARGVITSDSSLHGPAVGVQIQHHEDNHDDDDDDGDDGDDGEDGEDKDEDVDYKVEEIMEISSTPTPAAPTATATSTTSTTPTEPTLHTTALNADCGALALVASSVEVPPAEGSLTETLERPLIHPGHTPGDQDSDPNLS